MLRALALRAAPRPGGLVGRAVGPRFGPGALALPGRRAPRRPSACLAPPAPGLRVFRPVLGPGPPLGFAPGGRGCPPPVRCWPGGASPARLCPAPRGFACASFVSALSSWPLPGPHDTPLLALRAWVPSPRHTLPLVLRAPLRLLCPAYRGKGILPPTGPPAPFGGALRSNPLPQHPPRPLRPAGP